MSSAFELSDLEGGGRFLLGGVVFLGHTPKNASHVSHGTSQRSHGGVTFC